MVSPKNKEEEPQIQFSWGNLESTKPGVLCNISIEEMEGQEAQGLSQLPGLQRA